MLEIRRINAAEVTDSKKIGVVAFNGRHDFSQDQDMDKTPDPFEDPYIWTWGAFENGKMVSKMTELPYVMRFDGNDVKMSGIGGVATLPEARKGGKVRMIFDSLLNGAYADGVIFSCLVPFSHQFYRRFGYEVCTTRREMRVSTNELSRIKSVGAHEQIFPGDDISDLKKIHEAYIEDKNHAIRRDAIAPASAAATSTTKSTVASTAASVEAATTASVEAATTAAVVGPTTATATAST
ncbi:MAG: GNAT family N-acetyltransferase, partial [Oscillospiraceae bacterium]|nr:GNAT family N-acetyltransferase [Oscillospiraceae bacterium]